MFKRFFLIALCVAFTPLPALAQDDEYAPPSGNNIQPGNTAAQIDVQLSNLQDQLRQLRGQIEENQFEMKKLSDDLAKLQRDTDYRFNELANKVPATPPSPPAAQPPAAEQPPAAPPEEKTTLRKHEEPEESSGLTTAGSGILNPPNAAESDNPVTPRQLYNSAFRLLNQTKYPEAADAFSQFTKKFPKDPLVGNAFYWEGETYYIRHDYVKAADNFRKGFEALPDGPKAADNLLKLAMSLDALNHDKDACVVLQQIVTKYRKVSTSITEKASQEQKRIGCK